MISQVIIYQPIKKIEYECSRCRNRLSSYPIDGKCPICEIERRPKEEILDNVLNIFDFTERENNYNMQNTILEVLIDIRDELHIMNELKIQSIYSL